MAIILHPTNNSDELSIRHLRLLYSGYVNRWENGHAVDLVLPVGGGIAMQTLRDRIFPHLSEDEIKRFYLHAVFRQRLTERPVQLSSRKAINYVERHPGAIALVDAADVPPNSRLKITLIEGFKQR